MKLLDVSLQNFRNLADGTISLSPNITVLSGMNAQGKTNFLESIYLLALTKSFRVSKYQHLIRWDEDFCRIKARIQKPLHGTTDLEVFYEISPRKRSLARINEQPTKTKDYIGTFNVVAFTPYDFDIITQGPRFRRRYFDLLLSQTDPAYVMLFAQYQKALKERNALLGLVAENRASSSELSFWDQKLAEFGYEICVKRRAAVDYCNGLLSSSVNRIADDSAEYFISYQPSITALEDVSAYSEKFSSYQSRDIAYRSTNKGPQRDDFIFMKDGKPLEISASRGEMRTFLLALKLCEVAYIEKMTESIPVILLDDVFSELDQSRQKKLLDVFAAHQVIITTVDFGHEIGGEHVVYETIGGEIRVS